MQAGGHEFESRILHLMIEKSSVMYLENCIQRNIDDKIKKYLIKTSEVIVINRVIITTQFEENEFKKLT